ncbi:MAG: hypothetical protein IKW83_10900, partial [Muribaculaceae bacterium]|nr:hypothetical protein [Muribaculaceae bacterium]
NSLNITTMRLLNILNYFAEVSEVMRSRDNSFSSEEINGCNEQLAELAESNPFQNSESECLAMSGSLQTCMSL